MLMSVMTCHAVTRPVSAARVTPVTCEAGREAALLTSEIMMMVIRAGTNSGRGIITPLMTGAPSRWVKGRARLTG